MFDGATALPTPVGTQTQLNDALARGAKWVHGWRDDGQTTSEGGRTRRRPIRRGRDRPRITRTHGPVEPLGSQSAPVLGDPARRDVGVLFRKLLLDPSRPDVVRVIRKALSQAAQNLLTSPEGMVRAFFPR